MDTPYFLIKTRLEDGSVLPAVDPSAFEQVVCVEGLQTRKVFQREQWRGHGVAVRQRPQRVALAGWRGIACFGLAGSILTAGFLLPAGRLVLWAGRDCSVFVSETFLGLAGNSFMLAAIASLCCLLIALLLGYGKRLVLQGLTFDELHSVEAHVTNLSDVEYGDDVAVV